jgi:N-formylglutamate amidohydrolase
MTVFDFRKGSIPLLVSVPHDGRQLAPGQEERMTEVARALPDTDWHVRELYSFAADLGASIIAANYSRYVVDLNRPASDEPLYENQVATGVCPRMTFAGQDIYLDGDSPDDKEVQKRIEQYWKPYHEKISDTLDDLRKRFGYALLWDAHSIASRVPSLFDGLLPDLNIGTDTGQSCAPHVRGAVTSVAESSPYSSVTDGRFRGGYITRNYGAPEKGIHAVQLELAQCNYMDEKNLGYDAGRAVRLVETITSMLQAFMDAATQDAGPGDNR